MFQGVRLVKNFASVPVLAVPTEAIVKIKRMIAHLKQAWAMVIIFLLITKDVILLSTRREETCLVSNFFNQRGSLDAATVTQLHGNLQATFHSRSDCLTSLNGVGLS